MYHQKLTKCTHQRKCAICEIFKSHSIVNDGRQKQLSGWYYERNVETQEHISVCPQCTRQLELSI